MTSDMAKDKGTRRWVPAHRRMAIDIARAAMTIPSFPLLRRMQLGPIDALRRSSPQRIGWTALFVHAYGGVCCDIPSLRDIYVHWPTPYLYRHPEPIASVTVHRPDGRGNERLIWGRILSPQLRPLSEVQTAIHRFATEPIESIFSDGLRLERRPALLRRATWWMLTQWCGRKRAKHVGTFSISSLGGQGALNGHHPLVTTSSLAIGPLQANGECDVALICDHRAIDGALAAQALERLEQRLHDYTQSEATQGLSEPMSMCATRLAG
jgi:hypothetical protein